MSKEKHLHIAKGNLQALHQIGEKLEKNLNEAIADKAISAKGQERAEAALTKGQEAAIEFAKNIADEESGANG